MKSSPTSYFSEYLDDKFKDRNNDIRQRKKHRYNSGEIDNFKKSAISKNKPGKDYLTAT